MTDDVNALSADNTDQVWPAVPQPDPDTSAPDLSTEDYSQPLIIPRSRRKFKNQAAAIDAALGQPTGQPNVDPNATGGATLTPVDGNPFVNLTPVAGDPFNDKKTSSMAVSY